MPYKSFLKTVLDSYNRKTRDGLRSMANNTVRVADRTAPFRSKGGLKKGNVKIQPKGDDSISMEWPEPYTQFQNRGARADGSHRVKRYTTLGTGKGFVDKGIADTRNRQKEFFA